MLTAMISSLITGILTLIGVVITQKGNSDKVINDIKLEMIKNQARTDTTVNELTREVREHNNFARRMPVVEEQIKVINHRIEDLERKEEKLQ